jgi:uncharacterized LabA/DUF88 family protein
MLGRFATGRVAVFIDAANILYSEKDLGWRISYEKLKSYLGKECNVSAMYFYTAVDPDNHGQARFISKLKSLGLKIVSKRIKKIRIHSGEFVIKGNVDVELSMGMLEHVDSYDTAILMSGDSDFAPVVDKIKSFGKDIVVLSIDECVSRELLDRAKYIGLDKLKDEIGLDNKA